MRSPTGFPCEPAALAAAVRDLARDAYLARKGPYSDAYLADLAGRAARLRSGLGDRPTAPLGAWLESLARSLEDAVRRESSPTGRTFPVSPPPANRRSRPAILPAPAICRRPLDGITGAKGSTVFARTRGGRRGLAGPEREAACRVGGARSRVVGAGVAAIEPGGPAGGAAPG